MTDEIKVEIDSDSTPKRTRRTAPKKTASKAIATTAAEESAAATAVPVAANGEQAAPSADKPRRPRRKSTPKAVATEGSKATEQEKAEQPATTQEKASAPKRSGQSSRGRKPAAKTVSPKPDTAADTAADTAKDAQALPETEADAVKGAETEKAVKAQPEREPTAARSVKAPATKTETKPQGLPAAPEGERQSNVGQTQDILPPHAEGPNEAATVSTVENDAENDAEVAAEGSSEAGVEGPARKSRRGRRGGRGRRGKGKPASDSTDTDGAIPDGAELALSEMEETEEDEPNGNVLSPEEDDDDSLERTGRGKKTPRATAAAVKKNKVESADSKAESKADIKPGRRKMFISVIPGEQVEVALVEEGAIHEYYLEMSHQAKTKGNIYKGVVHNVDTNLQAAFVSYGTGKNGFLQIDEIHSEYYLAHHEAAKGKKFPPIQKVIKAGQEVLVQVVKEPTGNKGAFLTTWLSLPGRFLVLTPGQEQIGVSRKVDNDEERSRLREMMNGIEPGEGLGVIVRTVSAGTSKTTLKNDLQYLKRVWKEIRRRGTTESAPALIYQESSLAERAVRDYLTDDVCEVWVDSETVAESLREMVSLLFPRKEDLVRVHADVKQTLWERFNIQRQLEQIYSREVILPSGGRLVFDQTEALMAIDINSGKISGKGNFESMALKTNLEAAETIARQLKLRDIGGQVVIDFIEMRDKNHVRDVEKTLRNAMKNDRARHDVARMSSFGLMEIVRQRTGSSALAITMEPCPACKGTGIRRNMEWQAMQSLREIGRQSRTAPAGKCVFEASAELGMYLLNHKRDRLREMEQQMQVSIEIRIRP